MNIELDGSTKILPANKVQIHAPKDAEPVDFGRDTLLIICPLTHRALAVCRPIEGAQPRPAASRPEVRLPGQPDSEAIPSRGPLTEGQQEQLARIWRMNPKAGADVIATKFQQSYGREISIVTTMKYKPSDVA